VVSLRSLAEMKPEDRAQAAQRLLDDPLAMGILAVIEQDAINGMLDAEDDQGRREARDTVKTVRAFRQALAMQVRTLQETRREPRGIV
jgi:hypothetical protein